MVDIGKTIQLGTSVHGLFVVFQIDFVGAVVTKND